MTDTPVDAEGARADLRFGKQYFDRWFKQDLPKRPFRNPVMATFVGSLATTKPAKLDTLS